jgi:hypothetical protein
MAPHEVHKDMQKALLITPFVFHLVVCLRRCPKPLPKWSLHIVQSRASSFRLEYPLLSVRSSSSFLCLLLHLPVTSIPPSIFPSITCCRRQFLCKMWPIQLAFCLLVSCRIFFCSLTVILHFSHARSNWPSPSFSSTTFQNFPALYTKYSVSISTTPICHLNTLTFTQEHQCHPVNIDTYILMLLIVNLCNTMSCVFLLPKAVFSIMSLISQLDLSPEYSPGDFTSFPKVIWNCWCRDCLRHLRENRPAD